MGMVLKPDKGVLRVKGSVAYSMSSRAWNMIRLKKALLDEFPQLRERRVRVRYRMLFYRDPVELFLAVERMLDSKKELPILLYFEQEWRPAEN